MEVAAVIIVEMVIGVVMAVRVLTIVSVAIFMPVEREGLRRFAVSWFATR